MTTEEEKFKFEKERFEFEKKKSNHENIRFIVGSILLVALTSGVSFYIDILHSEKEDKRFEREFVQSEKQWIYARIHNIEAKDFQRKLKELDSFIEMEKSFKNKKDKDILMTYLSRLKKDIKEDQEKYNLALKAAEDEIIAKQFAQEKRNESLRLSQLDIEEEQKAAARKAALDAEKLAKEKAEKAKEAEKQKQALIDRIERQRDFLNHRTFIY